MDEPEPQGPVHDADAGHGQTYMSKVIIRLAGQGSHIVETALLLGKKLVNYLFICLGCLIVTFNIPI